MGVPEDEPGRLSAAFSSGFAERTSATSEDDSLPSSPGDQGRTPGATGAVTTSPAGLEAELSAACETGRTGLRAIGLAVDDETFSRHLGRVVARNKGPAASIAGLAIADLYLACTCQLRLPGAARELRARHGATIRLAIARIVPGADGAEIEQQLLDSLLVGSTTSAPKIGTYGGQAPLDRWLQVSAQRAALMWLRADQAEGRARRGAAAEPQLDRPHPEMAYLKARYRDDFEQALKGALGRVGERERVLLRLHLVKGLSAENIGKMYGVSQPTAWRWLARAREALLDDVKTELGERLGVSQGEMASLAVLVASGLDLSLSQLLRTR